MTISTNTSRWAAVGNGSTTVFPYNNKIFADTDLNVYLDGVLQTLTTHYTVSGAGTSAGGNVTFVTAPATGVSIVIVRAVANTQLIDYPAAGAFPSVATEDGLDRRTIISQQNTDKIGRSIQYLESDANLPSGILPTVDSLKGRYLKFNSSTGAPEAGVFDSGTTSRAVDQFAGDGATTAFTLSTGVGVAGTTIDVYVSGVHQDPDTYTVVGTALTFTEAPPAPPSGVATNIVAVISETVPIGETDAALVAYSSGGTGAASRTVAAKLQETISIEDFGVSTSSADNAAAIQAALNYTGNLHLDGRYLLKSALTRAGGLRLTGNGSLVWTSDAASTGLTVTLTSADGSSQQCQIGAVQFRTDKAGVGTALTVDATAQISGSALANRTHRRVSLQDTVFRGDDAPGVNGWLKHVVLNGVSNAELDGVYISGHLSPNEASIQSTIGIEADDQGNSAVLNLSRVSIYYCQKAVSYDGMEGVNLSQCNLVAVDSGVVAVNSNAGYAPQLTVANTHINARVRAINTDSIQGINVTGNTIWQRQSATATGAGVFIVDCDDVLVADNHFVGDYVNTSQSYYGVLIGTGCTDVIVQDNHGQDVTYLAWAQASSDEVKLINNTISKEAVLAPAPGLYANTSAARVIIDTERLSGKSASNITAASGTLVDVDMGTVYLGQTFLVTGKVTYTKGATGGITTTAVLKGAGTATVEFVHDDADVRHRSEQNATEVAVHTVTGPVVVTAAGTLTLRCQFTSAGSDATIAAGEAQLSAVQLGASGRLS